MQIFITGRHITLTNAIKNYALKKFEKLNDYFDFKESGELHITIDVQKYRHIAEGVLHSKQHEFTARVETKDMYSSIDMLEAKLLVQVKKHKDRIVKGEKIKNKRINLLANISNVKSMKGEKYNEIIEEELQALKPMNTEEAMEETETMEEKLLLFYNIDFNKVCLLRKRKDGKFGLTISKF
ncbi:MAG: ribosome-associated translation inhibitor RaiA [Candidatus Goldbacteria bacterium]|nr:ribosome-associated translation inhibitor RaiA [Candidatus Goldiibacteriota bacterium]